jgi:mRNA interferase MazF
VNDDTIGRLPLKVVVPITEWKERYSIAPWMVRLPAARGSGLSKPSAADCFQVRSISDERFMVRLGRLDGAMMERIREALAVVLAIR